MEGGGRASAALARQRAKREAEEKAKAESKEKPLCNDGGRAYNALQNQRGRQAEKAPKEPPGNFDIFRIHFVLAHQSTLCL